MKHTKKKEKGKMKKREKGKLISYEMVISFQLVSFSKVET